MKKFIEISLIHNRIVALHCRLLTIWIHSHHHEWIRGNKMRPRSLHKIQLLAVLLIMLGDVEHLNWNTSVDVKILIKDANLVKVYKNNLNCLCNLF